MAQSLRVGPHPCRLDGALGPSNSFAPARNRTEALDTARPAQSLEQAKVPEDFASIEGARYFRVVQTGTEGGLI
jgi:hypothetical protein